MLVNNVFLIKFVCYLINFSIFLLLFNVSFFCFFFCLDYFDRKLQAGGSLLYFFFSSLSYFKVPGWEGQK